MLVLPFYFTPYSEKREPVMKPGEVGLIAIEVIALVLL